MALKDFRESDFTHVMTGQNGEIVGINRRKNMKGMMLDNTKPYSGLREFPAVVAIDRQNSTAIANNRFYSSNTAWGEERKWGDYPAMSGATASHLAKLNSGEWLALGLNWTRPGNEEIGPAMKTICDHLQKDNPRLVAADGSQVMWVSNENLFRFFTVNSGMQSGSVKEIDSQTQPNERIVELLTGGSPPFGQWIARGESGSVYSEGTGGFASPIGELSPAVALRYSRWNGNIDGKPFQSTTLAARKPDGTWHASGTDEEFKQIIAGIGPALDLDLHVDNKLKIVLWIEPKTGLKP